jgi:hypothetical protein
MKLLIIYFIVTAILLLSKFLFNVCTFKYLKIFIKDNKITIDEYMNKCSLNYSDLIFYHFSTTSIKYENYFDEMSSFLINGSYMEAWVQFVCILSWMISIPLLLLYSLLAWLYELFEKFSRSILS